MRAKARNAIYAKRSTPLKKKNSQQEMIAKKLSIVFLILLFFSCKNSSSIVTTEMIDRIIISNSTLLKILISSNTKLNKEQTDHLQKISEINNKTNSNNIEAEYELLLDRFSKVDEIYFKSDNDKVELMNYFSTFSPNEQICQIKIEINKFLESQLAKSNYKSNQLDDQIFLTILPESFKVKPKEKFKADVILARKEGKIDGKLTLNNYRNKLAMKDGIYYFEEINNSKSDFSERKLEFQFETKINGKDTVLKVPFTYIIEN